MSHRVAKKARKLVKNWREKEFTTLWPRGSRKETPPVVLKPGCGRADYKVTKNVYTSSR